MERNDGEGGNLGPRLIWLFDFYGMVGRAMEDLKGFSIADTVDPLKKVVTFDLSGEIGSNYQPFCHILRSYAQVNECGVGYVRSQPKKLIAEIYMKRRLGPEMRKNPLNRR